MQSEAIHEASMTQTLRLLVARLLERVPLLKIECNDLQAAAKKYKVECILNGDYDDDDGFLALVPYTVGRFLINVNESTGHFSVIPVDPIPKLQTLLAKGFPIFISGNAFCVVSGTLEPHIMAGGTGRGGCTSHHSLLSTLSQGIRRSSQQDGQTPAQSW